MKIKQKSKPVCSRCGQEAEHFLGFSELEGMPVVCSRCVFYVLTKEKTGNLCEVPDYRFKD